MLRYCRSGFNSVRLRVASFNLHSVVGAIILGTLAISTSASAADIEVNESDKNERVIITIQGDIKSGDEDNFREIAAKYTDAIVLLDSEGGGIAAAMDIGRTIKLRGYTTAVYKSGLCASACALIWVAGSPRVVFEGGRIGFHASYLDTDGTKLQTGVGNALVGHYLSQLGFGQNTVVFATLAPPDKIFWLNSETASMSGIDYVTIPNEKADRPGRIAERGRTVPPAIIVPPSPPTNVARPQQETGTRPPNSGSSEYQRWMGDAKQTIRKPEIFVQGLRQKGYQATISSEIRNIPMIRVTSGGEEFAIGFSSCNVNGCNYIQLIDWYSDVTEEEAYFIAARTLFDERFSHPYYNKDDKSFALYNYIVIGTDGITLQTLIDNMNYFIRDNLRITDIIVQRRSQK